MAFLILFGLITACDTETVVYAEQCDVALTELSPESGTSGTTIQAYGRPMTTIWDTAVYLGNHRAELVDVTRDSCGSCDSCRTRQNCDACDDCDECDLVCADCVQSVTFVVPGIDPGQQPVTMYNQHGQTPPVSFLVTAGVPDTGATDTGGDTASPDSGASSPTDSGAVDTSHTDTGSSDTGPTISDG